MNFMERVKNRGLKEYTWTIKDVEKEEKHFPLKQRVREVKIKRCIMRLSGKRRIQTSEGKGSQVAGVV